MLTRFLNILQFKALLVRNLNLLNHIQLLGLFDSSLVLHILYFDLTVLPLRRERTPHAEVLHLLGGERRGHVLAVELLLLDWEYLFPRLQDHWRLDFDCSWRDLGLIGQERDIWEGRGI